MTSPIRDMAELRAACRAAKAERGVSLETIDHITGLPDGYSSKVLAPNPVKMVGNQSLGEIMQALGKMLLMVDDPAAIERVRHRWKKAKRGYVDKPATFSIAEVMAAKAKIAARNVPEMQGASIASNLEKMAELLAQLTQREKIVMGASKGGKRRAQILGKRARQRIAAHAARKRWAKRQELGAAGPG